MSIFKEGNISYVKNFILFSKIILLCSSNYLGYVKVKLQNQTKWHRRYCIIDWDKSILFIASKPDARYRDWIKLLPNTVINDSDYSSIGEANNNVLNNVIEVRVDSMKILFYKLNI